MIDHSLDNGFRVKNLVLLESAEVAQQQGFQKIENWERFGIMGFVFEACCSDAPAASPGEMEFCRVCRKCATSTLPYSNYMALRL